MTVGAVGAGFGNMPALQNVEQAANALEAMLFKELLRSMTDSAFGSDLVGAGFQADMYKDMYASTMAEQAAGAGTGISKMLRASLGSGDGQSISRSSLVGGHRGLQAYQRMVAGSVDPPVNARLHTIVSKWADGASADNWGKDGRLSRADLGADIRTETADGVAAFNVEDANGYEGFPKCNLFAFELLRRADYAVPLVSRERGWGYMGTNALTAQAASGATGEWATRVTNKSDGVLDQMAASGAPLLLTGSGYAGGVGHVAVADRIHRVQRDSEGGVAAIEYSGWEATGAGASYGRRVWRVNGVPGTGRGDLDRIELLAPRRVDQVGKQFVVATHDSPGASMRDGASVESLSSVARTPQELNRNADLNIQGM